MQVIDSHTEGEPTRMILSGGPDLGTGNMAERCALFAKKFDSVRSFAVNEPRGNDAVVGALLCEPVDPSCAAGLIFFNNVGFLGMCGHGTIGAAVTLAHLGRIGIGKHRFETPVGEVSVELVSKNKVHIENVPSYRHLSNVSVNVPGIGQVVGDVAWGGNWFFLVSQSPHPLNLSHVGALTQAAQAVEKALVSAGITGANGAKIDHIEFFGPPSNPAHQSRNFVLCPGGAYDRSPCGTGTSAKMACLAADNKLAPNQIWVQESVLGSHFEASYRIEEKVDDAGNNGGKKISQVIPKIRGRAYVVAQATLIRDPLDPFADGVRAS
jgi:4-hydroxyproline epimerase